MLSRRERFRQVLLRLDPVGTTSTAVASGWVQPPAGSFIERMRASLELDLPRRYLLMGGVGSGKTTELLRLKRALEQDPERLVVYLDVGEHADIRTLKIGSLAALIGRALCDVVQLPDGLQDWKRKFFDRSAFGYWADLEAEYHQNRAESIGIPGVMEWRDGSAQPRRTGIRGFGEVAEALDELLQQVAKHFRAVLVLIDGLDRLDRVDPLEPIIRYDVALFPHVEAPQVSTLLVAPLSLYLGTAQALRGGFDVEFLHLYRDPADERSNAWLNEVLKARVDDEMLPLVARQEVVRWSGGVLRDLLMIARASVEEAFLDAAEQVDPARVARVAAAHGRKLILGAGKEQLAALLELHRNGNFELITDEHVDLVLQRRVLFYEGNRYAVHPTIAPLLDRMPESTRVR